MSVSPSMKPTDLLIVSGLMIPALCARIALELDNASTPCLQTTYNYSQQGQQQQGGQQGYSSQQGYQSPQQGYGGSQARQLQASIALLKGGVMHREKAQVSSTSPSHVSRVLCRLAQLQLEVLTSMEHRRHRQTAMASRSPRLMGATRMAARLLMVAANPATVELQSQASLQQQLLMWVLS